MKKIKRTIRAYTITVKDLNANILQDQGIVWRRMAKLAYVGPGRQRCWDLGPKGQPTDSIGAEVTLHKGVVNGAFAKVKYTELPRAKDRKEVRATLPLSADQGLEYLCHFSWWNFGNLPFVGNAANSPPFGLLLWEYNHYAPRATMLRPYLEHVFPDYLVDLDPIIDDKALEALKKSQTCGAINVRVSRPSDIQAAAAKGDINSILPYAPFDSAHIDLSFKAYHGKGHDTKRALDQINRWKKLDEVTKLKVALRDGQILDLFGHEVKYRRDVPLTGPNSRYVDSDAVWKEIAHVFTLERERVASMFGRRWDGTVSLGA